MASQDFLKIVPATLVGRLEKGPDVPESVQSLYAGMQQRKHLDAKKAQEQLYDAQKDE